MNELTTTNNQLAEAQIDFKAKAVEWLKNMGTQLPPAQTAQFLELCQAYKLNPFKREIYAVGYGNKFNIITGYEVYLKRAERTGKLNGWTCVTNDDCTKAKITIYRKDWQHPFEHEVLLNEVKQNSPIWQKMPTFMMKKVCIEQGMRLCFPDELGGMPYAEEEVPYDRVIQSEMRNVKPETEAPANPETVSDNRMLLGDIMLKYEKQIDPKAYDMCKQALNSSDESEVADKLNRVIAYLGRKGIEVA